MSKQTKTNELHFVSVGCLLSYFSMPNIPQNPSQRLFSFLQGANVKSTHPKDYRADMQSTTDGNIELWYFESCISMWNFKLKPSAISPSSISKLVLHHACYPPKKWQLLDPHQQLFAQPHHDSLVQKPIRAKPKCFAGVWSMVFRSTMANLSRFRKTNVCANRACLFALELFQPINKSTRRRKVIQTNQRNSDVKTYMQVIQLNSCTFSTFSLV